MVVNIKTPLICKTNNIIDMKYIVLKNLPDWKLDDIKKNWEFYISNVGGKISIDKTTIIISWENTNISAFHHVFDLCNDIIENDFIVDNITNADVEIGTIFYTIRKIDEIVIIYDYSTNFVNHIDIGHIRINGIDGGTKILLNDNFEILEKIMK